MFPLTSNEAYIKSTGERSTLGDMLGQIEGDISNIKGDLTDLEDYVAETGVKNILPYEGSMIIPTSNESFGYASDEMYFKEGTQLILSCNQETTLTSAFRNTLFLRRSSTSTATYEATSSDYHLTAGIHTYSFTIPADGLYRVGIWCVTPNTDCTYSEFMLRDASITDPTYQPYAMTNRELTTLALKSFVLTTTTSLDDCTDNNTIYYIQDAQVPINAPENDAYNANVWNVNAGKYVLQFYGCANKKTLYFRFKTGSTWQAWQKITSTELV